MQRLIDGSRRHIEAATARCVDYAIIRLGSTSPTTTNQFICST